MIAIFGANGFIGRHITARFVAAGRSVDLKLFARDFSGFPFGLPKNVKTITSDFSEPDTYIEELAGCDQIILLTGMSGVGTLSDIQEEQQNIAPYKIFLEALAETQNKTPHIIYASSGGAVYGVCSPEPITEDHATNPISAYGRAKLAIEREIVNTAIPYTILRIANPVGIWNKKPSLVTAAINAVKTGNPLTIRGDGGAVRDYFAVEDLAEAVGLILSTAKAENRIYNIAGGRGYTITGVLDIVAEVAGKPVSVTYGPANKEDVPYNVLNCDRLYNDTSWKAKTDLKQSIKTIWEQG